MKALLQSEYLKLRTLRSTWFVIAAAAILSGLIGSVTVRHSITEPPPGGHPLRLSAVALGPVQALWFLAIGLAIVASAGEFQHHTIRTTVLLTPRRRQVLLAKAVVSGAFGAALLALGVAVSAAAGLVAAVTSSAPLQSGGLSDWVRVAAAVVLGLLWSVLAAGLGVLTRSTAIAITTLLLWRFVGEGLLPVIIGHPAVVGRWTPSGAANALVGLGGTHLLPAWSATALFTAYAVAVCASAAAVFTHRDAT
jgi:ABC-2 type transport system permease protein